MRKVILLVFAVFLLVVGCSSSGINNISYKKFNKMIEDKESFIVYIGSSDCSACQIFEPTFKDVLKEYEITSYHINLATLTDNEKEELKKVVSYSSTPTVAFIKNGIDAGILTHINDGSMSKNAIINRLKAFNYITEDNNTTKE